VRLALEDAGADYMDIARTEAGEDKMIHLMQSDEAEHPSFAPPFLKAGSLTIGQTANVLFYLGEKHGLSPKSESGRLWTHQLQLTMADLVAEVHDSHHPIAGSLYYDQQKDEAARRTKHLREERLPKYLGYFNRLLEKNGRPALCLSQGDEEAGAPLWCACAIARPRRGAPPHRRLPRVRSASAVYQ
jgi:glutathione S-transferase